MNYSIFMLAAVWCATATPADDSIEWRYVLPQSGDPHEYPPLRMIGVSNERPPDLREQVQYRGTQQRYAQIRYGSPGSIRVAVVLDQISPTEVDAYVDSNRNRIIEPKERIAQFATSTDRPGLAPSGITWRVPLDAAIVDGQTTRFERRNLILRFGTVGRTLSYAAAGYLDGKVIVSGRTVQVRRQDGDGNGLFTDVQDRLWFDLNGDGRWDPTSEQFLFSTILAIGNQRYVIRSDEIGSKLTVEPLEGIGKVQLAIQHRRPESGSILDMTATLVGRDGSAVGLRGESRDTDVPVGEYRVSSVRLLIADPTGGPPWNYVFSDNGGRLDQTWYRIDRDESVAIDPVGAVELATGVGDAILTCSPGRAISIQPRVYTGDGLLINACFRGTQQSTGNEGPAAAIFLAGADGKPVDSTQSGFA